jgi:phosphatidylglycerophosphate synthase
VSLGVPLVALAHGPWLVGAAALVVLCGVLDSADGAVAVLQDRATALGYVLDSVVDRLGEVCFLLALWLAGAPAWACIVAGGIAWLQEYARARAVGAGMTGIGVVTVAERATRVVITALGLLVAGVVAPRPGAVVASVAIAVWVTLGLIGSAQLALAVRRRLAGVTPGR